MFSCNFRENQTIKSPHVNWFYLLFCVYQEVNRILLGMNRGKALETISLPESAKALSSGHNFDLQVRSYFNCCAMTCDYHSHPSSS